MELIALYHGNYQIVYERLSKVHFYGIFTEITDKIFYGATTNKDFIASPQEIWTEVFQFFSFIHFLSVNN